MVYVAVGLMLVCLGAGAILLDRGRRRAAAWSFGVAALLGMNLAVLVMARALERF